LDEIFEHRLIDYRTYCDLREQEPKKVLTICKMFADENKISLQSVKEIFKIINYERNREV